ncbi:hypothetical protein [Spirosoma endbachense]|uniref:Uncharacterized protein n=1 Tax=Spirosoma endbachense TaxID=2666025 RepID=A0A6P1VTI3_9BACT|nr:hypothetical protein [Spirosoma endbachense]QHV96541.1 hypothetical protein GJR95_16645 [Spirosoma endbachense]
MVTTPNSAIPGHAKIEELTLYSIQLEKANKQQADELQVVKQKQTELERLLKQVLKQS